jgi:nitrate reductase assembly molybdenum cofactor insertion protein NarJ
MDDAWVNYQAAQSKLPKLKKKLEDHSSGKAVDPDHAITMQEYTDLIAIEKEFFDLFDGKKTKPLTKTQVQVESEELSKKLDEIKPQVEDLPLNHPNRKLVDVISAYLERMNLMRGMKYDRAMRDIVKEKERSLTKTNTRGFKGNTTTTVDTIKETKENIAASRVLANAATKGGNIFRRELDKFLSTKAVLNGVIQPSIFTKQFVKTFRLLPPKLDVAQQLSDKLFDIIKIYDYKFIKAYEQHVKTLKSYDPNNPSQFAKAADAAAAKVRSTEEIAMINYLIETVESTLREEIDNAILVLGKKPTDTGSILSQIQKTNPNLSRQIGLDNNGLKILIGKLRESGGNITIEDFLALKQKVVPNMTNQWIAPLRFVIYGAIIGKGVQLTWPLLQSISPFKGKPNEKKDEGPKPPSSIDILTRAREQAGS